MTSAEETPALAVTGLQVEFSSGPFYDRHRTTAVDGVDLRIERGETLGLVGETGSGKSTLARAVAGLCRSLGTIEIDGLRVSGERRRFRALAPHVQMVFQDPLASLNPRMRIQDAVAEPLLINRPGMSRGERQRAVLEVLEEVHLAHRATAYPHELSGGQRQRAAIARALALSPALVLCDEPTSGLDVTTQAHVLRLLRKLQDRFGCAYLFISHDLRTVHHISDQIAVMYLGRIVEIGPSERVFTRPSHPYTAALLSAIPGRPKVRPVELRGETGSTSEPDGCRFRWKCPMAAPICAAERPPLMPVPGGGTAECHFPDVVTTGERPATGT